MLRPFSNLLALIAITLTSLIAAPGNAQNQTSMDLVPGSASFYWSSMNNGAKLDALLNSRAFQKWLESPAIEQLVAGMKQGFWEGFSNSWESDGENDMDDIWALLNHPDTQKAFGVLGEAWSNEVFAYGDQDWIDFSSRLNRVFSEVYSFTAAAGFDEIEDEEKAIEFLKKIAESELRDMQIPTLVVGGRLWDPPGAPSPDFPRIQMSCGT